MYPPLPAVIGRVRQVALLVCLIHSDSLRPPCDGYSLAVGTEEIEQALAYLDGVSGSGMAGMTSGPDRDLQLGAGSTGP